MSDWNEGFLCGILAALPNAFDHHYVTAFLVCMAAMTMIIFRPRSAP